MMSIEVPESNEGRIHVWEQTRYLAHRERGVLMFSSGEPLMRYLVRNFTMVLSLWRCIRVELAAQGQKHPSLGAILSATA